MTEQYKFSNELISLDYIQNGFTNNRGFPYLNYSYVCQSSPYSFPTYHTNGHPNLNLLAEGKNLTLSSQDWNPWPTYPDDWPSVPSYRFYNQDLYDASWTLGTWEAMPEISGSLYGSSIGFRLQAGDEDTQFSTNEIYQSRSMLVPTIADTRSLFYLTPDVTYYLSLRVMIPSADMTYGLDSQWPMLWQWHNNSSIVDGAPDWTFILTNKNRQFCVNMGQSLYSAQNKFIMPIGTTDDYLEQDVWYNWFIIYKPSLTNGIFQVYQSTGTDEATLIWDFADEEDGGGLWVANRTLPVNGIDDQNKTQYFSFGNYFNSFGDSVRWHDGIPRTSEIIWDYLRLATSTNESTTDINNQPWLFTSSDTEAPTLNATSAPSESSSTESSITWTWNAATDNIGVDHYVPYIHSVNLVPDPLFTGTKGDPITSWKEDLNGTDWSFGGAGSVLHFTASGAEDRLWTSCMTIGNVGHIKFHVFVIAGTLKIACGTTDLITLTTADNDTDIDFYVTSITSSNLTLVADAAFSGVVTPHSEETGFVYRELQAQTPQASPSFTYNTSQNKTEVLTYTAVDAANNVSVLSDYGLGTSDTATPPTIVAKDIIKHGSLNTDIVFDVSAQATLDTITGKVRVDTLNQPSTGGTVAKTDGDTTVTFTPTTNWSGGPVTSTYDLISANPYIVDSDLFIDNYSDTVSFSKGNLPELQDNDLVVIFMVQAGSDAALVTEYVSSQGFTVINFGFATSPDRNGALAYKYITSVAGEDTTWFIVSDQATHRIEANLAVIRGADPTTPIVANSTLVFGNNDCTPQAPNIATGETYTLVLTNAHINKYENPPGTHTISAPSGTTMLVSTFRNDNNYKGTHGLAYAVIDANTTTTFGSWGTDPIDDTMDYTLHTIAIGADSAKGTESNTGTLYIYTDTAISYLSMDVEKTSAQCTANNSISIAATATQTGNLDVIWSVSHPTIASVSVLYTPGDPDDKQATILIEPDDTELGDHTITVLVEDGSNIVSKDITVRVLEYRQSIDVVKIEDNAIDKYYFQIPTVNGAIYSKYPDFPDLVGATWSVDLNTGLIELVVTDETAQPWVVKWKASTSNSVDYGTVIFVYKQHIGKITKQLKTVGILT